MEWFLQVHLTSSSKSKRNIENYTIRDPTDQSPNEDIIINNVPIDDDISEADNLLFFNHNVFLITNSHFLVTKTHRKSKKLF